MDWESPVDAWYVWIGISMISLAMAGVVLALPTGPPPDAASSANTIDRISGSQYEASGVYDHDAAEVKIDGATIALRNDHGTDRATLRYGSVVPVWETDRLLNLTRGTDFETAYGDFDDDGDGVETLLADANDAYRNNTGEWRPADGEFAVRTITVDAYWFERWSAEPADRDQVSVEVRESPGWKPETVVFEYTVTEEAELFFEVLDDDWHPLDETERTVHGSGTVELSVDNGDPDESVDYPVRTNVEYRTRLDDESTARLTGGAESAAHFDRVDEPSPETVARTLEWLEYDAESDVYRVTLVTA